MKTDEYYCSLFLKNTELRQLRMFSACFITSNMRNLLDPGEQWRNARPFDSGQPATLRRALTYFPGDDPIGARYRSFDPARGNRKCDCVVAN